MTKVEVVKDKEGFLSLENVWNRLAEQYQNPLLRFNWLFAGWEAFHNQDRLFIVVVRSGQEVVAIAPLVLVEMHGTPRLEVIGIEQLYEPSGFLAINYGALQALVNGIVDLGYPVLFLRVSEKSGLSKCLRSFPRRKAFALFRQSVGTQAVEIASSWNEYYMSLSSRRRYDHRRAHRRAVAAGGISFDIITPDESNIKACVERFIKIEASGWKSRARSALVHRENLRYFFTKLAIAESKNGLIQFHFLQIDGADASGQIAVVYLNRMWILKIGYDEKWSHCSPGILLTNMALEYAFEHRFRSYEFLGSEEPWIDVWSTMTRSYLSIGFFPISLYGIKGFLGELVMFCYRKIT